MLGPYIGARLNLLMFNSIYHKKCYLTFENGSNKLPPFNIRVIAYCCDGIAAVLPIRNNISCKKKRLNINKDISAASIENRSNIVSIGKKFEKS